MKRTLLLLALLMPSTAFAAAGMMGGVGPLKTSEAGVTAIRCDMAQERLGRSVWVPQSRTQCYRGCLGYRVRAWCNRWCDNHCR